MSQERRHTSGLPDQSVYVLTPLQSQSGDSRRHLALELIQRVWGRRYWIVAITAGCALMGLIVAALRPDTYQATATLIVLPPTFSTELKPPVLPVEVYRVLAESSTIEAKVTNTLEAEGADAQSLLLRATLQSSREGRNANYLPLIELNVTAKSGELAQRAANLWAQVVAEETANISDRGREDTLEFIKVQFPQISETLAKKEEVLQERQDQFDKALLGLEVSSNEHLVAYDTETERMLQEYQAETSRLILDYNAETARLTKAHEKETQALRMEFLDRWKPDWVDEQVTQKKTKLAQLQDDLINLDLEASSKKDRIAQLRVELEKQPERLVLSKGITDEAVWAEISRGGSASVPGSIADLKLSTEIVNPVHMNLKEDLARTQISLETQIPRMEYVKQEIARLKGEIEELSTLSTTKQIELFNLTSDRELELTNLLAQRDAGRARLEESRASGLKLLQAQRDAERSNLESSDANLREAKRRERSVVLGRLTREKESIRGTYGVLAGKYESALLAKSEQNRDVKIGSLADLPRKSNRSMLLLVTMVAGILGFCVSLCFFLLAEYMKVVEPR